MRLAIVFVISLVVVPACAEFEGDPHEQVRAPKEIELVDTLPAGYQIIGHVSESAEHIIDGNSLVEWALWCELDRRFLRRMKRAAAENGGELLVGFECVHEEVEDTSTIHDDPDTNRVETELTCSTECSGAVARAIEAQED